MTEQELLLRLERLEARGEIENLMARYQHYYTLRNSQAILDELWAEDVCGITLEDRFYGVYEGRSGPFPDAGMKTYYDSAMGFGSPSDHPGKLVVYTLTTQALEVAADWPHRKRALAVHRSGRGRRRAVLSRSGSAGPQGVRRPPDPA